jgi:hypothetical protein
MKKPSEDSYSETETSRRMDDALRRALTTPPKPHKDIAGKKAKSPKQGKARISRHQGR